ncbi:MAG: PH domain-containing protein [Planctomycetes bacterium]|nr:PH domain-containing protein [Planctomycetota bacterium]
MTCENDPPAAARWGGSFNAGGVMTSEAPELSAQRVDAVPAGLVHDDEIVILLLRPSLLYIPLACLTSLTLIAVVTLALALLATKLSWIPWVDSHAYALGVVLVAARLAWQALDWWGRLFILTDRRIIRRMGVLHVCAFEARLKSIQHTSVFRLLRERLFGLGTIGFATAGSDVFDAFWVMVRQPFAVHRVVVDAIHRYGGG